MNTISIQIVSNGYLVTITSTSYFYPGMSTVSSNTESKVFTSKESLLEYLNKELK